MAALDDQLHANNVESTQARAFAASELVPCPSCSRANPPTRESCLYCGDVLPLPALEVSATVAVETEPESNHVIVFIPHQSERNEEAIAKAARLLDLSKSEMIALRKAEIASPLRVVPVSDAREICECLRELKIPAVAVAEEKLNPEMAPKNIRALKLNDDDLIGICRQSRERIAVDWEDVTLIVAGRLHTTTLEVEQKRNRKQNQILDERELSSDEAVLDIYTRDDPSGWRIRGGSFDFSCLGEAKALTAFENIAALTSLLERSSYASFDNAYGKLRSVLNRVWPIEQSEGPTEHRRNARGRIDAKISSRNNENQFTRYSRLLWLVDTGRTKENE